MNQSAAGAAKPSLTDPNSILAHFETMKQLRSEINTVFTDIDGKLKSLNALHSELVRTHTDVNFRFGLDSFHFQNKLIHTENENMKMCFTYIDNRIYCEYYKLHKMIYDYITTEICDKTFIEKMLVTHKKYTVYKDLEPAKVYDFHMTQEICNNINQCMIEMRAFLITKKNELQHCEVQSGLGFNIHNLINEQKYKLVLFEEKINMFTRYLTTFNIHHMNYFTRLMSKLKLMNDIVNEDIDLKQVVRTQGANVETLYYDTTQMYKKQPTQAPAPAAPAAAALKSFDSVNSFTFERSLSETSFTPMYNRSSQASILSTISEQLEEDEKPSEEKTPILTPEETPDSTPAISEHGEADADSNPEAEV
jgi:hypothetical protein